MPFISVRTASQQSSLSTRNIYKLIADRKIRHYKIGKRILLNPEDLETYIREGCQEPIDWAEELVR